MTRAHKNWLALGVIQYCPAAYWRLLPRSWIDIRFINAYGRPRTRRVLAKWGLGTDELARKGSRRIADLESAKVKGRSETEFQKSVDEAANLKKEIVSAKRKPMGAVGLRKHFAKCPKPITPPGRTRHLISPATASEIRKTLGITQAEMRNVLRAFRAAGIRL